MFSEEEVREVLSESGLRVTYQRLLVLKFLKNTDTHPSADEVVEYVKQSHPNISTAAVYHILDTFVEKNIIKKIVSVDNKMHYDAITEKHHHVIDQNGNIFDYFDEELTEMLSNYFKNKNINGGSIKDYNIQLFINKKK